MTTYTYYTFCSGGGIIEAGINETKRFKHLFGVEIDPRVAAFAEANGFNPIINCVSKVNYKEEIAKFGLSEVDAAHFSPICTHASVATKKGEQDLDMLIAKALIRSVDETRPKVVTIENVQQYKYFQSYRYIIRELRKRGYTVKDKVLNSADFGVSQTRKRMFIHASRIGNIGFPDATHSKEGAPADMFCPARPKWVGWRSVTENLPDKGLKPAEMTPAIKKLLTRNGRNLMSQNVFVDIRNTGVRDKTRPLTARWYDQPAFTLTATMDSGKSRVMWDGTSNVFNEHGYMRVMSIPDSYDISPGNFADKMKVIGNGVPSLVGKCVYEYLANYLDKKLH